MEALSDIFLGCQRAPSGRGSADDYHLRQLRD
jgi:hypothetical protein